MPAASSPVTLQVEIPGQLPVGLLFVEVQQGALLSAEQPVVVLPSQGMAQEVEQLLSRCETDKHMAIWPSGMPNPMKGTEKPMRAALAAGCWASAGCCCCWDESRPCRPPTACTLSLLCLRVQDAGR